jgi:hypothetical protein
MYLTSTFATRDGALGPMGGEGEIVEVDGSFLPVGILSSSC